jgi:tRNA A-37 threonylcarbamoyl transferase component Bud32
MGGQTGEVRMCSKKQFVKKHVTRYLGQDCYEREIGVLKLLNEHKFDWCPTLIKTYDDEKTFIMNYCGNSMMKTNRPTDYKKQVEQILNDMKSIDLKHNDIKNTEVLVCNSKIFIVDFGWASIKDDFSCGLGNISTKKKPCGIYEDNRILNF